METLKSKRTVKQIGQIINVKFKLWQTVSKKPTKTKRELKYTNKMDVESIFRIH